MFINQLLAQEAAQNKEPHGHCEDCGKATFAPGTITSYTGPICNDPGHFAEKNAVKL